MLGWTCGEVEQVLQAAGGQLSLVLAPGHEVDRAIQRNAIDQREPADSHGFAIEHSGSFEDQQYTRDEDLTIAAATRPIGSIESDDPYA